MTPRADSKERRTKMAKFKAGDVVEIISGLNKGERGTVGSPNAGTENGKTLVSVYGDVKYIVPEDYLRLVNSRTPRSSNAVVRNALAAIGSGIEAANARTARNAEYDINDMLKDDINKVSDRITFELKKQAENYAYWMEANCGRSLDAMMRSAAEPENKGKVSPSIIAEIKKLRKRVDDAIAASKRLPR